MTESKYLGPSAMALKNWLEKKVITMKIDEKHAFVWTGLKNLLKSNGIRINPEGAELVLWTAYLILQPILDETESIDADGLRYAEEQINRLSKSLNEMNKIIQEKNYNKLFSEKNRKRNKKDSTGCC